MTEDIKDKPSMEESIKPYRPIVDALIDKHALEVTVHNLSEVSGFTEAFIVAIARSDLHAQTLRDTASDMLDQMKLEYKVEGEYSKRWCLMDAGHLVINILSREGRDYYRLDSLWGDAPAAKFQDTDD